MHNVRKTYMVILSMIGPCVVFLLMAGELFFRYPCNHGGGFWGYIYIITIFILLNMVTLFRFTVSRIGLLISLLCLLLLFLSDYLNMYLSYDTWVERGMPDWGTYQGK